MKNKIVATLLISMLALSCNTEESIKDINGRILSELIIEKKIEVDFIQASIKSIHLRISKNAWHDIKILIPAGTVLLPRDNLIQTMVCIRNIELLADDGWQIIEVPVACSNMHKKTPDKYFEFQIINKSENTELKKLLDHIHSENLDLPYETVQAAVWIVSDNATFSDLRKLSINNNDVLRSMRYLDHSIINQKEAALGIQLCIDAGIDIKSKKIYDDFYFIFATLNTDEKLEFEFLNIHK